MSASAAAADRRIGLIAGYGTFPIQFARDVRQQGMETVCIAIRGSASPELARYVDQIHWMGIAKLGKMIRTFRRHGITNAVMAGKVSKQQLYLPWRVIHFMPDWRCVKFYLFANRKDNRDDSLLLGIIDEFQRDGITIESALDYCGELLVKEGVLTKRSPSATERLDIEFGWDLAKEMGRLDVGQTVAIKEQSTLAVEALEGTDKAIQRAGRLCPRGGFTVVKVAKPQQDMRFDVPTIGPDTIKNLFKAGASVLAIEADQTILLEEEATIQLANLYGLAIVAYRDNQIQRLAG